MYVKLQYVRKALLCTRKVQYVRKSLVCTQSFNMYVKFSMYVNLYVNRCSLTYVHAKLSTYPVYTHSSAYTRGTERSPHTFASFIQSKHDGQMTRRMETFMYYERYFSNRCVQTKIGHIMSIYVHFVSILCQFL